MSTFDFRSFTLPSPKFDDIAAEYREANQAIDAASTAEERWEAVRQWDQLRRRHASWESLVHVRFQQDTRDEKAKADREYCDKLRPKVTDLDVAFKRKLLSSEHRPELEQRLGPQAFALWDCEVAAFDPKIEDDLVRESELEAKYVELLASASFDFQGEKTNLPGLDKYNEHLDRQVRHDAERLRWQWFGDHRQQLDDLYDQQVKVRHKMATDLGYDNYIGLAYKRMCRVDYNQHDVERYRQEVREHVVPLAVKLRQRQAELLGVEKLMSWDEGLHDPQGNPRPQGEHDWMLERAQEMFDEMGCQLDEFFRMMTASSLLDLKTRDGKAGGGFCTDFPSMDVPFIFANFNGTLGDVLVFTHEVGHAFQFWLSAKKPLVDYTFPTYESCEIHSMSLEFLTWPHMDKFFGEHADRFRRQHLAGALLFLPYGVAVDHFQHLVYAQPDATPTERFAMWREMEQMYLPWRDWGDIAHGAEGGRWQLQRHVFLNPFYYIDYTLAQTCALQFWARAEDDFKEAMQDYVALCRRGGEAAFRELANSAGLTSPFEKGCLSGVMEKAARALDLA